MDVENVELIIETLYGEKAYEKAQELLILEMVKHERVDGHLPNQKLIDLYVDVCRHLHKKKFGAQT